MIRPPGTAARRMHATPFGRAQVGHFTDSAVMPCTFAPGVSPPPVRHAPYSSGPSSMPRASAVWHGQSAAS